MIADHSNEPFRALQQHLKRQVHWKTVALRLFIGLCVLAVVVWFGRYATDQIHTMESWIADHRVWGRVVFVGMIILFTSMFVLDTVLSVAAGLLLGLAWGSLLIFIGCIATAAVNYLGARRLLRPRIEKLLGQHPQLQAIQHAAKREGLRLQLLLRLAPINPVSISYVLGASGVRFSTFMLATIGLIPGLLI